IGNLHCAACSGREAKRFFVRASQAVRHPSVDVQKPPTAFHPVADFVLSMPQARCTAVYSARKRPLRVSLFELVGGSTPYNMGAVKNPYHIETMMYFLDRTKSHEVRMV